MKLEKVILKGFRGYRERTEVDVSSLTALIGENDVGKSTILEGLDAFFNDVVDAQDVSTRSDGGRFTVGCVFSDLPDQINLDAQSQTTLQDEYLLNELGKLEIYKVWRTTTVKAEVAYLWAIEELMILYEEEFYVGTVDVDNTEVRKSILESIRLLNQVIESPWIGPDTLSSSVLGRAEFNNYLGAASQVVIDDCRRVINMNANQDDVASARKCLTSYDTN